MKGKLTLRKRWKKCVSALSGLTFVLTTFVNRGKWKKRRGTVEIVRETEETEDKVGEEQEKEKKEGKSMGKHWQFRRKEGSRGEELLIRCSLWQKVRIAKERLTVKGQSFSVSWVGPMPCYVLAHHLWGRAESPSTAALQVPFLWGTRFSKQR